MCISGLSLDAEIQNQRRDKHLLQEIMWELSELQFGINLVVKNLKVEVPAKIFTTIPPNLVVLESAVKSQPTYGSPIVFSRQP